MLRFGYTPKRQGQIPFGRAINSMRKPALLSASVCAVLAFVALNSTLTLATTRWSKGKAIRQSALNIACDTAVEEYQHTRNPDLVLMGSSLMMAPVWSLDAKLYRNSTLPVFLHHKSQFLQQKLAEYGSSSRVFSFALPGSMVSDMYLVAQKLFKDEQKPTVVVYGIAPRDLMDDLLTGETRTPIFQNLVELQDFASIGDMYLSTWQEKCDFVFSNAFFLYGKRWRYQDKVNQIASNAYDSLLPASKKTPVADTTCGEHNFLTGTDRAAAWSRSTDEYKKRYAHFNEQQFAKQHSFLEAYIALAKEREFSLVLVNMPLTQDNLQLMPSGLYRKYKEALANLARRNNIELIDMQTEASFTDEHFYDTVHLNAAGAQLLLTKLVDRIAAEGSYLCQSTSAGANNISDNSVIP